MTNSTPPQKNADRVTPLSRPLSILPGISVKNRLFKSAMSEQLADRNHVPTKELIHLYRTWAKGGTGLLVTGNVMIDRTALGEPRNVVLDEESDPSLFRKWAEAGRQNSTQIWMQLNHPGKQIPNFLSTEPVAPSAVPLGNGLEKTFNCPRELTQDEIVNIIRKFAWSAAQAKEFGFTGIQIHAAHGYLINQFLSPHHNRRNDQWGGTLENRLRFLREVYSAIRGAVGKDFPVGIKLNSADFQKGGFSEEDSMQVLQTLQSEGINLIEISGGNYENPSMVGANVRESTIKREAYFLDYAEKARARLQIPVVVTGGFRSAAAMEAALTSKAVDMIGLARPLAVDPHLTHKLLSDGNHKIALKKLTTGIPSLDFMAMLDVTWYEQQLARIGSGKPAKPNMSAWASVLKTLASVSLLSFQRRRA
ncbi:NADH:flavin oxidoreductase/NADH oxidase family protein [Microbulbifer sp. GL-2]|uniref:NADH:flavin oxidoreductase/NADH oxidase family protein n=1 Tax=Microbulbifer sp. GL-2 TaxID=2591606 RepID=UPI001162D10B|nr:NADH:flavin oxidoreductase/NADH oxidase family protein [Microbulbifer sp. GL-2]BBM01911.1 NADH oxidase [Microbulbifer sp. GL-2]